MHSKGSASLEPDKEPIINEEAVPDNSNANKSARLLPMDLRKRRRAVKLQTSTEKKAKMTSIETASQNLLPQTRPSGINEKTVENSIPKKISFKSELAAGASSKPVLAQSHSLSGLQESLQVKGPLHTVSTRLHSLYHSSHLSQNSQRRQLVPGANVTSNFKVAKLPLDMVPKQKLSILTAMPFPFRRVTSKIKQEALQHFMSTEDQVEVQNTAVRWQQALHYFTFPADPLPTFILLNRASTGSTSDLFCGGMQRECQREENDFFTARWNLWQEAFRDVYINFRYQFSRQMNAGGKEISFYLCSSDFIVTILYEAEEQDASKLDMSIIDLCHQYDAKNESMQVANKKSSQTCRIRAVMSRSSARIRKSLHQLNVAYTMPYIEANQARREVGEFHLLEEELKASYQQNKNRHSGTGIAPLTPTTATPEAMHGADSLLLFHGHESVHGLYEYLINRTPMSNQDVPKLYALHPFANASIQSLRVATFGQVDTITTRSVSVEPKPRSVSLFRLEILGFCFPSSITKLLAVLADEWQANYSSSHSVQMTVAKEKGETVVRAVMEAVAGTERLNAIKLDEQAAKGFHESSSGQYERQKELEFSKRRIDVAVMANTESHVYNVNVTTQARR